MSDLPDLSWLLHEHHRITMEIAAIARRSAGRGHLGEFIAAAIFDIALAEGANQRGSDGVFCSSP